MAAPDPTVTVAAPDRAMTSAAQLLQSARDMQCVVTYAERLASHAERLPPATEKTADLHTSIQDLTDDLGTAARALRAQCLSALEGLAAVQGLACPDELMD